MIIVLIVLLLSVSVVSAEPWHTLPGTLATIDSIESGIVRFEVVVPDGVTFIHLPANLFDYPIKEGDQYMLRFTEYDDSDRRSRLQDRLDKLLNRRASH